MVKQYQIDIDPDRLRGFFLTLTNVKRAIEGSNQELGGSVLELAEAEYRIRFKGYVETTDDIGMSSVPTVRRRLSISSVLLDDVAQKIYVGPAPRRGVADLDGQGEVVGGIVVMRDGANALETIAAVKQKLARLKKSFPPGVELVETYDRSALIVGAVDNLKTKLLLEFAWVFLICAFFLWHVRSSLVVLITLPMGILAAFFIMQQQGISANIMSLGGIAIAIGAMVDATIVLIENVHKRLEQSDPSAPISSVIEQAACEVGPALFLSLLIITLSFLPVFALQGQEGRLFESLAYTKTYSMAAAALISVTIVPALLVLLVRGNIQPEENNPVSRGLIRLYRPLIDKALRAPWIVILPSILLILSAIWPSIRLGSEFLPQMDEGDLLYMPTTLPGISIGKARQLLQQTDRLIAGHPEVDRVFGKVGRAETATDPAPLTMIETVIRLKPKSEWRDGVTLTQIKQELDRRVRIPGLRNAWLSPIRTRIDMQSTGINTPIGIKIAGDDLTEIDTLGRRLEAILGGMKGTAAVYSDRSMGARYIEIEIDRLAAGHYGLSIEEIEEAANIAIAGQNVTTLIKGRERYPVNLRYPREWRDSIAKLKSLPLVITEDTQIQLEDVAEVAIVDGPPLIKSENGRLNGWIYLSTDGMDVGSYVKKARQAIDRQLQLPPGYTLEWVGQYQYMVRSWERLVYIVPLTLLIIFILLYLIFGTLIEAGMVMLTAPLALIGALWIIYWIGFNLSVAVAVGFIALLGVAAEFGVMMLIYLRQAIQQRQPRNEKALRSAIIEGAATRVRPKVMTVAVIALGLLPVFFGTGAGSELMQRIAAPMVAGMVTAPLVSMCLLPVIYFLWCRARLRKGPFDNEEK